MKKILAGSFLAVALLLSVHSVDAAMPVFLRDFRVHSFDGSILAALGYDSSASVTYFRELGSVTEEQLRARRAYEAIGCHPFYVFRGGRSEEVGYNCRSFFCVGYSKGPKQCRDTDGKAYSGVMEISRRLGLVTITDIRKDFASYPASEQTSSMKASITKLAPYQCKPLYLLDFDVVVGEGYRCDEVGQYPYFSSKNVCIEDYRKNLGLVCEVPIRADEMEKRAEAIAKVSGTLTSSGARVSSASSLSSSSGSSVSSASSDSSVSSSSITFPDVTEGKYGYTAIMDLTARGIIKGYADGLFRPKNAVNRAEFVKVLMTTLHSDQIWGEVNCFRDVKTEWFSGVVCAAKRLAWVSGYGDNTFRPGQTMRKNEAIKVIVEALDAPLNSNAVLPDGVTENQWYTPYVRKAVELDIILETSFQPTALVTRADAAVWIYRALKAEAAGLLPEATK